MASAAAPQCGCVEGFPVRAETCECELQICELLLNIWSLSNRDYQHHWGWRRYQPHLPARFRLTDGELPSEERWSWEGLAVHLDRYELPGAPLTIVGLHGGGGYGRLMAPIGVLARRLGFEAVLPDLPGYGLTA